MRQNSKHKSNDENRLLEIDSLKSTKEIRLFFPGNRLSDIDFQKSIFGIQLSDIDRPNNKDRFSTIDYRYSIFGNRASHIDSLQSIP